MENSVLADKTLLALNKLFPSTGVLFIGIGDGSVSRELLELIGNPKSCLVEGFCEKTSLSINGLCAQEAHLFIQCVVSEFGGVADCYRLSNERENGLLSALSLKGIWRNLETIETKKIETRTIESIVDEATNAGLTINWMYIDCLPAGQLLRGAKRSLESCDVIITRMLLSEITLCSNADAHRNEIYRYLTSCNYIELSIFEDINPIVGYGIYIRDWKSIALNGRGELAAKSIANEESFLYLTNELEHQIENRQQLELSNEKLEIEISVLRSELANQEAVTSDTRDYAEKLRSILKVVTEEAGDLRCKHREALSEVNTLKTQCGCLEIELINAKKIIEDNEKREAQIVYRQNLVDREVLKSQGQIELIKDLLLREEGW